SNTGGTPENNSFLLLKNEQEIRRPLPSKHYLALRIHGHLLMSNHHKGPSFNT
ncbi:hypothetical protein STEG23_021925, partial [Scotinomys teguina]